MFSEGCQAVNERGLGGVSSKHFFSEKYVRCLLMNGSYILAAHMCVFKNEGSGCQLVGAD